MEESFHFYLQMKTNYLFFVLMSTHMFLPFTHIDYIGVYHKMFEPTFKHGGGSVMIRGLKTVVGRSHLHITNGISNQ